MAFNIMDLIKDQITPDNIGIGAIAGMLGEDEKKTSSGIAGAIPAVLGGLLGSAGIPQALLP